MNKTTLQQNLQYLRKSKGLNQADMESAVGIKGNTWSTYERGTAEPTTASMKKIAKFFEVSIDDLLYEKLFIDKIVLGSNLRFVRLSHGLNPAAFIQKLEGLENAVDYPAMWIFDIENGKTDMPDQVENLMNELASEMGYEIEQLDNIYTEYLDPALIELNLLRIENQKLKKSKSLADVGGTTKLIPNSK